MDNYVVCPHCKRTLTNNPVIDDAAKSQGAASQSILCECGERISYWQITAQLRAHTPLAGDFRTGVGTFSHSHS